MRTAVLLSALLAGRAYAAPAPAALMRSALPPGVAAALLGEPVFICESNPTVEHIAQLIYQHASKEGLPVVRVKVWETPTSFAEFGE